MLFESAVVHDLAVFDAVVTIPDGRWGAVEVKLGGGQIAAGVQSVNRVVEQIDTDALGEPAFRLVVTGTGPTLVADDGTVITSLRNLAP